MPNRREVSKTLALAAAAAMISPGRTAAGEDVYIDLHTHLFNVLYLPIEGIAAGWCENHCIDREIGMAVARVLNEIAASRQLPEIETDTLFAEGSDEREIELLAGEATPEILDRAEIWRGLERIGARAERLAPTQKNFRTLLGAFGEARPRSLFSRGWTFFRWLRLMVRPVERIHSMMVKASGGKGRFVHHLMDMSGFYDPPDARLAVAAQIDAMADLMKKREGLIGFVAWNPLKPRESLASIENAIGRGFLGVKFYPPNGYRPSGNADEWGVRGKRLDDANRELYDFCSRQGVPILSHCTPEGVESKPEYGCFSDPRHWIPVLTQFPSLRLCLGHAGGEGFWFDVPPPKACGGRHFGGDVLQLCARSGNVWAEFGYLNGLYDGDNGEKLAGKIARALPGTKLGERICFGTDWHMPSMFAGRPDRYRARFRAIVRKHLPKLEKRFFEQNALEFLRL